jgi:very-short-patch-repair endonuclease
MIKKFGKPYAGQVSSCQEKRTMTLFKNNKQMVSRPQKHICNLLNGVLNFPCGNYSLDIILNNISIAIEYNGSGHDLNVKIGRITKEEFIKKERTRNYFVIRSGWKLMQITSNNDKLPNDNTLLKMINLAKEYLLNTNHSWINIDLNNKCFIFTKEHIKIPFDSLKTIL